MTPVIYDELVRVLRREPMRLTKLHAIAVDAGSTWSVDQLHLMLAVMDGIEVDAGDGDDPLVRLGERSLQEELADAIAEVVRSQGRPIPAAQVLKLLPSRFTTSVEQIKKIARETSGLQVVGPGLIAAEK
jgi:hypothetical protein